MIGFKDIRNGLRRIFEFCSLQKQPESDPLVELCLAHIDRYYDGLAKGTADYDVLMGIASMEQQMTQFQRYALYEGLGAINEDLFRAHPELTWSSKEAVVAHVSATFSRIAMDMAPNETSRLAAMYAFYIHAKDPVAAPSSPSVH